MQTAGDVSSIEMIINTILVLAYHVHVCDFLCNGITNNVFTEFIDDEFVKTIALQFNLKYYRKIGIAISETAPEKLIRYYLNNKKTFKYNYGGKYLYGVDAYEDFIYEISTKIAQQSEDFKEKHYKRIKDQYYEIADFREAMTKKFV